MNFFDKILGMHVGKTILLNHNHVRTMRRLIKNVMFVEKWNGRVYVSPKYLMGEILSYLVTFHSIGNFCVYIFATTFWYNILDH
jgi:hypothetical protein